jgi:hypothetical protein
VSPGIDKDDEEECARRREVDTDGRGISLVAPEDLNRSKVESAKENRSHMQLDDVENCSTQCKTHRAYLVACPSIVKCNEERYAACGERTVSSDARVPDG